MFSLHLVVFFPLAVLQNNTGCTAFQLQLEVDGEGQPILHVTYAKFKEGEATVREAKVSSNYGTLKSF